MSGWLVGMQAAAAGLSIAGSLFGGKKSNKMSAEQIALIGQQAEIAKNLRGIGEDQYGRYQEFSDPVFDQIFEEVFKGPDYEGAMGTATADVNQAFDNQLDTMQRHNFRYGVNPSSGMMQETIRRNGLDRSLATVNAKNRARREEDDRHWARLLTGGNTVNSFLNASIQANSGAMGGMGQAASGYGSAADKYSQSAGNGLTAGMYMANQAIDNWGSSNGGPGADYGPNGIDVDQWLSQPEF